MQPATTRMTIATLALGLLSCGGTSDGQSSFVSRVAQAASRSVMSVIVETEDRNESESTDTPTPAPLMLVASRPDSILGTESLSGGDSVTVAEGRTSRHVVTPPAIATHVRKCGDSTYRSLGELPREARLETTECPLLNRRKAGNITRI